jgi:redox-sensing transcriptional repressor
VGLGRLGSAILAYERFSNSGYSIIAGFDSNINKLETIRTNIELFPAHDITDIVRRKKIDVGVIAVPASAAQESADRLIEGGARGIVNFSPALIQLKRKDVHITNLDIVTEFSILSAFMTLKQNLE